jgi:aldose 1-epimerase
MAAAKAIWRGGSPFTALTAVWPTNDEGKYVIEAEGIRLAFTNHGAALANLWINDTKGQEIDVVLGLDHADQYPKSTSNPYLNGIIGKSMNYRRFLLHRLVRTCQLMERIQGDMPAT